MMPWSASGCTLDRASCFESLVSYGRDLLVGVFYFFLGKFSGEIGGSGNISSHATIWPRTFA